MTIGVIPRKCKQEVFPQIKLQITKEKEAKWLLRTLKESLEK